MYFEILNKVSGLNLAGENSTKCYKSNWMWIVWLIAY